MCVVLFAAVCFVNEAGAQGYKYDGFYLVTLGVHTSDGVAFNGLTGYAGGSKNNKGLGILGSYESGSRTVYGYPMRIQIANVYFTALYKLGRSKFFISQGVSTVIYTIGKEREDRSLSTTAISYVFDPGKWFYLFAQARLQGQGLMLSAGVGF